MLFIKEKDFLLKCKSIMKNYEKKAKDFNLTF